MTDLITQYQWEQHHYLSAKQGICLRELNHNIYGQAKLPSAKFLSFPDIRFPP